MCNDQGVMGSGIALQVKKTWPSAFISYKQNSDLGSVTYSDDFQVANMVAQQNYRRKASDTTRFLNYGALSECLHTVSCIFSRDCEVVIPYKMGADRAGGDWDIVLEMVEYYFDHCNIVVCEL